MQDRHVKKIEYKEFENVPDFVRIITLVEKINELVKYHNEQEDLEESYFEPPKRH